MKIQGLANDWLLINNPIYMRIYDMAENTSMVQMVLTTTIGGVESSRIFKYFPFDNEIIFDLAPLIKSMYNKPSDNNNYSTQTNINTIQKFTIVFNGYVWNTSTNSYDITTTTYTKRFVRGGKFNYENNVQANIGNLQPSAVLPIWEGYPSAYYQLTNHPDGRINKIPIDTESDTFYFYTEEIKKLQIKSENGAYIKFLNQNGGYSYWLFEVNETKLKTKNSDYYIRPYPNSSSQWQTRFDNSTQIVDLGNKTEKEISVSSVVHQEFIEIIEHLMYSHDVAIWINNKWIKLLTSSNSMTYDNNKQVYDVSFSFDMYTSNTNTLL